MFNLPVCLIIVVVLHLSSQITVAHAATLAITPFYTFNQSPVVQIFGLPAAESSITQRPGHYWGLLATDVANNYASGVRHGDKILLDGESYRLTVALRYGITDKLELGADLPWVAYSGGALDSLIEGWHRIFGLTQGGRLDAPRDRLHFSYSRDGQERLHLDEANFGLGDLRLTGGWQLYNDGSVSPRAVALRACLKLPTGSSSKLHGSGSTDLSLWLTGSDDYLLPDSWGHLTLFGAAGAMALTNGRVLEEQQNNLVGFGTLGMGWSPADWIALKAQLSTHSPFYTSDLRELGKSALQLVFGGTLGISARTALDLGISEDLIVAASPDLAFHLGLSHQF